MTRPKAIDLSSLSKFEKHPWVRALKERHEKDAVLADHATQCLYRDLVDSNQEHNEHHGRVLFSTIEFRVKTPRSFFRKLWRTAVKEGNQRGVTQDTLRDMYDSIKDLAGVRFCCPYLDEVEKAINDIIRPALNSRGYATDFGADPRLADKNWLDDGDEAGYRSYHFYVNVPTPVDIWDSRQLVLCEVQGRSELQHVWAVKSHDLLYNKKEEEWNFELEREDMRHLGNALSGADGFLQSIRNRVMEREKRDAS